MKINRRAPRARRFMWTFITVMVAQQYYAPPLAALVS